MRAQPDSADRSSTGRALHSHASRLLRAGAFLFAASLLNGFAIQATRLPRLALSAHLVGLIGSGFLIALAAIWPQLNFRPGTSRVTAALAIYGLIASWLLYLTAAVTGAAGLFPIAGGGARGGALIERLMSAAFLTVAVALFVLIVLLLGQAHGEVTYERRQARGRF